VPIIDVAIWWVQQKSRFIRQSLERWEVRQQIHRLWCFVSGAIPTERGAPKARETAI
jgi:hypothetical protein